MFVSPTARRGDFAPISGFHMTFDEVQEIQTALVAIWRQRERDDEYNCIESVWNRYINPVLEKRAIDESLPRSEYGPLLNAERETMREFFLATHEFDFANDKFKYSYFWAHQKFNVLNAGNETQSKVNKDQLAQAAATYLGRTELQTNFVDWCFLDAMVFLECDSFAYNMMATSFGSGLLNWAFPLAGGNPLKYALLRVISWLLSVIVFLGIPAALGIYLLANDWVYTGVGLLVLTGIAIIRRIISAPFKWRVRKNNVKLLQKMLDVYGLLSGATISPRKLKEALDAAANAGVVFDQAIFGIVDRMFARDSTVFVPR